MLPNVLMLLDFSASDVVAVVYTPIVHHHTLEGPSKKPHPVVGPCAELHVLEGANKKTRQLTGAK